MACLSKFDSARAQAVDTQSPIFFVFFSSCSFQGCNFLERKCQLDPTAITPDASKGLPPML